MIFDLAHKLTGTMEAQNTRHEVVITNVVRRMSQLGQPDLMSYLNYVSGSESELAHFISAVTIHTTAWFREMPHYKRFEHNLALQPSRLPNRKLRLLSAACSTGEELYSFGMILETFRRQQPSFDYELVGFDVDPICVQRADTGFYHIGDLSPIPESYRHYLISRKAGEANYVIDPDIRRRSSFQVGNLMDSETFILDPFDIVVCRNVLIYFSESKRNGIVANLLGVLKADGSLTLGHSESIDSRHFNLNALGESSYRRADEHIILPTREKPVSVLAVDDSSWARLWMATALAEHGIKVISANTTDAADEFLSRNRFDLITLDLNLPGQNGKKWLTNLRREGTNVPVILLTETRAEEAAEVLEALSGGSQDYINKSQIGEKSFELAERIKGLVKAHRVKAEAPQKPATFAEFRYRSPVPLFRPDVILIGASTGGTDAICQILSQMQPDCPPIVCVQHIPREFSAAFLERLARTSRLKPATPESGKALMAGHIYLSTSDAHIGVRLNGEKLGIYYSHGEKISGHRPSVDYLFQTASFMRGKKIVACLLTGMGRDGAQGLLELRRMGALTLAQDEQSSVVWGMPGEAVKLGAPQVVGNLKELHEIIKQCTKIPKAA